MQTSSLYAIEVTGDIALKIRQLAEAGLFSAKGGSMEIHFDTEGNISQFVTHSYRKIPKAVDNLLAPQIG